MADMQPQEPEEPIRRPPPIVPVSVPAQIMEPEPIPDSEVLYDTSEDAYEVRIQTYFLKYSHLNSDIICLQPEPWRTASCPLDLKYGRIHIMCYN
ncbi:hypothetical protein LOD99_9692 [Oopsacas minuta]|uniref:Uncharacterized protein n=1 Tax=Oopsacas minuta TaxID=111878 RepID=A0AAV7KKF7_9METZ|nr:hypothetical protein LOD99_9692 [Oopsacas minuta]